EDQERGLGPGAAGGGQSRADRGQGELALCGDLAERGAVGSTGALRGTLLRARRHGEPDQGAAELVCRSGERRDDAGQSTAAVLLGDGLCVGERAAALGPEGDGARPGAGVHDSHPAAEDRCPGTGDGTQGLGVDGLQLSLAAAADASDAIYTNGGGVCRYKVQRPVNGPKSAQFSSPREAIFHPG